MTLVRPIVALHAVSLFGVFTSSTGSIQVALIRIFGALQKIVNRPNGNFELSCGFANWVVSVPVVCDT